MMGHSWVLKYVPDVGPAVEGSSTSLDPPTPKAKARSVTFHEDTKGMTSVGAFPGRFAPNRLPRSKHTPKVVRN